MSGDEVERIIAEVSIFYGLQPRRLRRPDRHQRVALARAVAMYLVRKASPKLYSYPEIGSRFGRDHSTVIAAVHKVERLRSEDVRIDADVTCLEANLGLVKKPNRRGDLGVEEPPAPEERVKIVSEAPPGDAESLDSASK